MGLIRMSGIKDFQKMMREIYYDRDVERGLYRSALWLISEIGELVDAIVKGDAEALNKEAADAMAWLCSVCNLLEVYLEKVVYERYNQHCPRCGESPCECPKEWEKHEQRNCWP